MFASWAVATERCFRVDFGELWRCGVAALRRPALPALPPGLDCRFIAIAPGQSIVAGQACLPEVASSQCRKLDRPMSALGQKRRFRRSARCSLYPRMWSAPPQLEYGRIAVA